MGTAQARLRVGSQGPTDLLLASIAIPLMGVVLVFAVGTAVTTSGGDRVWAIVGTVVGLLGLAAFVLWWLRGVTGVRPILVQPGKDGWVSIPQQLRFRLRRLVVPLRDVRTVELEYLSLPRDGRWQLVVRTGDARIASDSVSSAKPSTKAHAVRETPAYRAVEELRQYVVDAQA